MAMEILPPNRGVAINSAAGAVAPGPRGVRGPLQHNYSCLPLLKLGAAGFIFLAYVSAQYTLAITLNNCNN